MNAASSAASTRREAEPSFGRTPARQSSEMSSAAKKRPAALAFTQQQQQQQQQQPRPSPSSASTNAVVVDLKNDDDNDVQVVNNINDNNNNNNNNVIDLEEQSQQSNDEAQDDEDENLVPRLLYRLTSADCQRNHSVPLKIVGIRYYRGMARAGEYVQLRREPHNPYDRHAIRVDNMHGDKVGHVNKEAAEILSPVWDAYETRATTPTTTTDSAADHQQQQQPGITIDASIPYSHRNQFWHPLQLEIRAPSILWHDLQARLAPLVPRHLRDPSSSSLGESAAAAATTSPTGKNRVNVATKRLDWKQQQQLELDRVWQDLLKAQLQGLPIVPVPSALVSQLFDHQREALNWLVHREQQEQEQEQSNSQQQHPLYKREEQNGRTVYVCQLTQASQPSLPPLVRGGILADDMGLGKTCATLALILAQPPPGITYTPGRYAAKQQDSDKASMSLLWNDDNVDNDERDTSIEKTLSLTEIKAHPTALLRQAAARLLPHCNLTKKAEICQALHKAWQSKQITATAWQDALSEKAPSSKAKKSAPKAKSSSKSAKTRPITLIVAPVSVLSNWQDQIETHIAPDTLRVALYQGPDRQALLQQAQNGNNVPDIWITSFHTLQYDYRPLDVASKGKQKQEPPPTKKAKTSANKSIFDLTFFRVILDEGHVVRNTKSSTFRACAALQAERRWCLTGTPLTNKPEDIHSLLKFLRVEPLAEGDVFRRAIAQPIKEGDERGLASLRLVMAYTALRRSKNIISLPEKSMELRSVTASSDDCQHKKIYDTIYESARAALGAVLRQADEKEDGKQNKVSHTSIFEVLMRLRQACCSGTLVPQERLVAAEKVLKMVYSKDELTADEGRELLEKLKGVLETDKYGEDAVPECAICLEEMGASQAVVLRKCGHVFCQLCLKKTLDYKTVCPFCRTSYQQDDLILYQKAEQAMANADGESKESASLTENWDCIGPSPKMEALLLALEEMMPDEKGVVFSQFTTFLNQLEVFLTEKGWSYVRIDGSKSQAQRISAIQAFNSPEGPRLVLCSLHAAGTGINLTRGNHVFLMDTWWNEAVERQAQDRIHRLGQQRACRVVRFVTADSIESRMVDLQEVKAALGKGAFENLTADEKRKARMDDLKKLLEL